MANGLDDYPGWGVSGEGIPAFGPTGGWTCLVARQLGSGAAAGCHTNGIAWIYGAGGTQYVFARDPKLDVTTYEAVKTTRRVCCRSRS